MFEEDFLTVDMEIRRAGQQTAYLLRGPKRGGSMYDRWITVFTEVETRHAAYIQTYFLLHFARINPRRNRFKMNTIWRMPAHSLPFPPPLAGLISFTLHHGGPSFS